MRRTQNPANRPDPGLRGGVLRRSHGGRQAIHGPDEPAPSLVLHYLGGGAVMVKLGLSAMA